jgi:hypothetical protein
VPGRKLTVRLFAFWFDIVIIYLIKTSAYKKNAQKIKTEPDEKHYGRKMLNFFYLGHNLGNPVEYADPGKNKKNAPHKLNCSSVFFHTISQPGELCADPVCGHDSILIVANQ